MVTFEKTCNLLVSSSTTIPNTFSYSPEFQAVMMHGLETAIPTNYLDSIGWAFPGRGRDAGGTNMHLGWAGASFFGWEC